MIASPVKPGRIVLARDDNYERVALPMADGLAHPGVDGRGTWILEQDIAHCAGIFIGKDDRFSALKNLEREGHICRPRNARQVTLDLRIALEPVRLVVLLYRQRLERIGNWSILDDAQTSRD